jgi:hypothetical protein
MIINIRKMNQIYGIPNRIKQPAHCCIYCGKTYKLRSNVDKHMTLCELVHKSKRNGFIVEDDDETPSLKKMYKMLLELGKKYNTLEEKVEEINKFVVKKKKKINVLEWLNANIQSSLVFEKLHEQISIIDEDISYLLTNSFNDTLNGIFNRSIYNVSESEYPIFAFTQKANMFYVYDKNAEDKIEWQELSREKLIKFLNKVHMKLSKHFNDWKKKQINEIKENDSFATICDKTLVKLMSVEFKQDAIFGKTRSSMYSRMKTDMKALVEYEFEF